jgi:hypothetical protein
MNALVRTFLAVVAVMLPATTLADTLGRLHKSFMERYDEANSKRDDQLRQLDQSYLAALLRQQDKAKASGKLDAVLPWVGEIQSIKTGANPLPDLAEGAPGELKQMRAKHAESRDRIIKSHAIAITGLADKMEQALKSQESELTKAGKIDEALAAKHMRETLAGDQAIRSAGDLLKLGGPAGTDRPALRIRRFGDNLEVLVLYDRSGKVSMDSPVQNVREETGGKKELGDTKAKVLGEFVGAKGYTVDPYNAYHQVFDGRDLGNFGLTEIVAEFQHEENDQKGVRLSLKPQPVNPHGSFGPILPPNAAKGTYRISTRYLVPKSNRAVSGFIFVHGIGSPIGGKKFEKNAKWTSEEVVGASSNDTGTLLFYLTMEDGAKAADAGNDSIVLGELKVEHIGFSAYLLSRIDSNGRPAETVTDPAKQPLFISNGDFVGK